MNHQDSIDLLFKSVDRQIPRGEVDQLLNYQISNKSYLNHYFTPSQDKVTTLKNHPFINMLSGHPQAIQLAGQSLKNQTLVDLFKQFESVDVGETLSSHGGSINTVWKSSLDISIKNLSEDALKLFKILSLFRSGIRSERLDVL
jgi:hypothetical protein